MLTRPWFCAQKMSEPHDDDDRHDEQDGAPRVGRPAPSRRLRGRPARTTFVALVETVVHAHGLRQIRAETMPFAGRLHARWSGG